MAGIEKVCEYSGEYPGWLMYGYKHNHIQIMPKYRKEFRGAEHTLHIFMGEYWNNLMPLAWKYGVSVYFQDTGVCVVVCKSYRESVILPEDIKPAIQQALITIAREVCGE